MKNYMNEDYRSYIGNFCSCGKKAWKKFRLVRDLNLWPLRCRCSALTIKLLASQLGAGRWKRTSLNFFSGFLFATAKVAYITSMIFIHIINLSQLTNHSWVYQEVDYRNEILKTMLTGSSTPCLLSPHEVFSQLFSIRFPLYFGAWKRL